MQNFYSKRIWRSPSLIGLASVVLSVFTLIGLIMIFWPIIFPEYTRFDFKDSIEPIEIQGVQFTPVIFGSGGYEGYSAVIKELSSGQAVISAKTYFSANYYPFIEWDASGLHPGVQIQLFWRRQDNPSELQSAKLHFLKDGNHTFDLAKYSEWRGQIIELSVGIFGNLRDQKFIFKATTLRPFSLLVAVKVIPEQWASSYIWKANSINYSIGTISRDHMPPGLFFGFLFLISTLLIGIISRFLWRFDYPTTAIPRTRAFVTVIFICWVGMDAPRMVGRFEQAKETNFLFAGKTLAERAATSEQRCFLLSKLWLERNQKYRLDCGYDPPLPNF